MIRRKRCLIEKGCLTQGQRMLEDKIGTERRMLTSRTVIRLPRGIVLEGQQEVGRARMPKRLGDMGRPGICPVGRGERTRKGRELVVCLAARGLRLVSGVVVHWQRRQGREAKDRAGGVEVEEEVGGVVRHGGRGKRGEGERGGL